MVLHSYVIIPVFENGTDIYKYKITVPIYHPLVTFSHVTEVDVLTHRVGVCNI